MYDVLLEQASCSMGWVFARLSKLLPSVNGSSYSHSCVNPRRTLGRPFTCSNASKLREFEILGPRLTSVLNSIEKEEEEEDKKTPTKIIDSPRVDYPAQENVEIEVCHPWPEWIQMVDRLAEANFLYGNNDVKDDVNDHVPEASHNDARILKALRNGCLRFGLHRFDIFKSLSKRDIQIIVGSGCPSIDGKVVTSGKRLRAYVRLNEGNVCSACSLRASCEKAYMMPRREDAARTLDVMRILMTYAYYPLIRSSENKLPMRKSVKESVRKLLRQVVELSATPIDPALSEPIFVAPSPKVKKLQPPKRKKRRGDDIEKKKGDWLCPRCDFMNFAKNNTCIQCDEIRPKPKLNQGQWECVGCGFVNYRRNLTCYKCESNRPQGYYMNSSIEGSQQLTYSEWKWKKPVGWEDS